MKVTWRKNVAKVDGATSSERSRHDATTRWYTSATGKFRVVYFYAHTNASYTSTGLYCMVEEILYPKLTVEWEQWPGYGYGPDSALAVTSANRHSCLTPAKNKEHRYQHWTNRGRYDQSAEDIILFICSLVSVNRNIAGYNKYSYYCSYSFLGHRLGDDLVDWNSGVSIRPSVRPYVHKKFFRFPSNLVCG